VVKKAILAESIRSSIPLSTQMFFDGYNAMCSRLTASRPILVVREAKTRAMDHYSRLHKGSIGASWGTGNSGPGWTTLATVYFGFHLMHIMLGCSLTFFGIASWDMREKIGFWVVGGGGQS
jgi:hypothetical protein